MLKYETLGLFGLMPVLSRVKDTRTSISGSASSRAGLLKGVWESISVEMPGGGIGFFLVLVITVLIVLAVYLFPSSVCYIFVYGFGRISNIYKLIRLSEDVIDGKKLYL